MEDTLQMEDCSLISKYVVQLFKQTTLDEPIDIIPYATGVLVTIDYKHYLLTAGHVYDGNENDNIGFFRDNFFYPLHGEIKYTKAESHENDPDVAVCKLNPDVVNELKYNYNFLPFEQINSQHKLTAETKYYILGYPVSKTKKIRKYNQLKVNHFYYRTKGIIEKKEYELINANLNFHYLFDYHMKKLHRNGCRSKQQSPKPQGMSGSGVWYWENNKFSLIGIITYWNGQASILQATKIDIILDIISFY